MTTAPAHQVVSLAGLVHYNSETVTDYAFRRDMAQSTWPYHTVVTREAEIRRISMFPALRLTHYTWRDVNPDGQYCRFDMIVDADSDVVNLFHTEYWTRVACTDCEYSYATRYIAVTDADGVTHPAAPFCDEHGRAVKRITDRQPGYSWAESEYLLVGEHD